MNEILLLSFILIVLTSIQTIVGVGVLVIGTPVMLLANYNIIDILTILLPTSIMISLINTFYFNFKFKNDFVKVEKNLKKKFFFICIPSIFLGLVLLKKYEEFLNLNYLVSFVIVISIFLKFKYEKVKKVSSRIINYIMFIIGVIHGLSNSGGSLLSLFLININNKNKLLSRINITFFYLFLALFQYLLFQILFYKIPQSSELIAIIVSVSVGFILGNNIEKIIDSKTFDKFVIVITALAAVFLLTKSI